MLGPITCKTIDLSSVSTEDRSYLFSFPKRDIFLIESIKNWGLLQPPILYLPKEGAFQIICGEGRVLACKTIGFKEIKALVLKNLSPKELLLISLESNLFRNLNLVEKAEFLNKAIPLFTLDEILILMKKINLPPNNIWLKILLEINKLDIEFKNLIINDKLNLHILQFFKFLNEIEKKEFLLVITRLNLSFSEQREVLEKLLDLKRRLRLTSLLPEELKDALNHEEFNQRRKTFFERLKELYYPNLSAKMMTLKPYIEKLQKKQINVKLSPYLEKKEIELIFKVKDSQEFSQKIEFLTQNEEVIKKILETI